MKTLLTCVLLLLAVKGDPTFEISSTQELIDFSKKVNSGTSFSGTTVYLTNDIDYTGFSDQFTPIGDIPNSFRGIFDGNGHTISHLSVKNTRRWTYGFFASSSSVTVRNFIMDQTCSISGLSPTNSSSYEPIFTYIGGIFGSCSGSCTLENSIFMGKVEFLGNAPKDIYVIVGGLAARFYSYSSATTIKNCVNYGTVIFSGKSDVTTMGGIVGTISYDSNAATNEATAMISNCLNYGLIMHTGTTLYRLNIGGIVGRAENSAAIIDNVVNLGLILSNSNRRDRIGSIVGYVSDIAVTHSYWLGGSIYGPVGDYGSGASLDACANISSSSLQLLSPVRVGKYYGYSLISALNAGVDLYASSREYSKWLLNKDNNAVSFVNADEGRPFCKINTQLILTPTLAGGQDKKFKCWYTDASCTTLLKNYEVSSDVSLYGKWAKQ